MFTPQTDIAARVEADHVRLRKLSSELTQFMKEDVASEHFLPWKLAALVRLRDFENQVAKHFDLEEEGGFIDDLLRLAPESANTINHLAEDHRSMLDELSSVISEVKSYELLSEASLPRLRRKLRAFLKRLKEHESAETALLYQAHFQVNGAGD